VICRLLAADHGKRVLIMHQGHRERVRERFLKEGLDSFQPHEVLEFLLFYCIPRRDTNEIAHRLINEFGCLSNVLEAPVEKLAEVKGISKNTAVLLSMLPHLSRYYLKDRWGQRPVLNSSRKAGQYAAALLTGKSYEEFLVICLDSQNKVIQVENIHKGTVNEAVVYPRLVLETALKYKANSVIFAHNHPGGSLKPSSADIELTAKLKHLLNGISIRVNDHIIAAGTEFFSFAENGMI
jgi:DNA repair protein RadC